MTTPKHAVQQMLSPADAARAVVAAGHGAEVVHGPSWLGTQVPYVDDAGTPLLLVPCGAPRPVGTLTLRFRVWPLLGAVEMAVSAEEPVSAERRRRVLDSLLDNHSRCLERHEVPCPARLVALSVHAVRLVTDRDDQGEPVDLDDYQVARPCLFRTFGPSLMTHLTNGHQENLITLVRSTSLAADPLAVEAVGLDPEGMRLRVIELTGSRERRIAFARPLVHPHCLGTELQRIIKAAEGS